MGEDRGACDLGEDGPPEKGPAGRRGGQPLEVSAERAIRHVQAGLGADEQARRVRGRRHDYVHEHRLIGRCQVHRAGRGRGHGQQGHDEENHRGASPPAQGVREQPQADGPEPASAPGGSLSARGLVFRQVSAFWHSGQVTTALQAETYARAYRQRRGPSPEALATGWRTAWRRASSEATTVTCRRALVTAV